MYIHVYSFPEPRVTYNFLLLQASPLLSRARGPFRPFALCSPLCSLAAPSLSDSRQYASRVQSVLRETSAGVCTVGNRAEKYPNSENLQDHTSLNETIRLDTIQGSGGFSEVRIDGV